METFFYYSQKLNEGFDSRSLAVYLFNGLELTHN